MIIAKGGGVVQTDVLDQSLTTTVDRGGAPETSPLAWTWDAPWLGTSWDLTDFSSPVIKLRGVTGAGGAAPEHWWSEAPTIDGADWGGFRTPRGELFLPLMVQGQSSQDFLVQHRLFRSSLSPAREGILSVVQPDGETRWINCRYVSGADSPVTLDPVAACRATYGITWSTDPFWNGDPVSASFVNDPGAPFFPGPPFSLGKGLTITDASVTNPGDIEAFPVWRVWGPYTGFTVGVGANVVTMSLSRSAGQYVDVDTRPGFKTIIDASGVNRFGAATTVKMNHSIKPGRDVPLFVTVTGAGVGSQVDLSFTPRYWSAW